MATVIDTNEEQKHRLEEIWKRPPGLTGWARAVSSSSVGVRIMVTAFVFFLLGGVLGLLMRTQLIRPENSFLDAETYNQLFTMHGTTMLFLFAVPMAEGLFTYLVPGAIGARDLSFPRLNAFSYWTYLFGGLVLYSGFLVALLPATGWFSYYPLSGPEYSPTKGMDLWLLGVTLTEISAIAFAVDMITSIFRLRAPGMSINRMPLLTWGALVVAFLILFGFPPVIVASLFLEVERTWLWPFYDAARGGDPLLWQHLFWIFGHPEVYIVFIPGAALVDTLVPTFTRRPVVGYPLLAASLVTTGVIGMGVWVHHMFTTGLPEISMAFFAAASMAVSIPSGLQIFAWLATIWTGRPVLKTPFLFVIGFIVIFVLGGLSGVMLALVPFDWQVHDSYFVVAHFHYVMIGGMVFPLIGGLHYYYSRWTGRLMSERLGKWTFWTMFVGFNLAFFPMHNSGLLGMPRRVYTYPANIGWDTTNLLSTLGAYLFALGVLLFVANFFWSLRRGEKSPPNPWGAPGLDWSSPAPVPSYKHRSIPFIRSRYPLWEQPELHDEIEQGKGWLATPVADHRETLATTLLDAEPEQVLRLPRPTSWPLWTALALTATVVSFLGPWYWAAALGTALTLFCAVMWHWPREDRTPEGDGLREGLPVNLGGRRATAWTGMSLFQGANAMGFAMVLFSYFYLRNRAEGWPPAGAVPPELLLPALALAALLAASAAFAWAERASRSGQSGLPGLLLAAVLVAGFLALLGVHVADYLDAGVRPQETGYAAAFYAVLAYVALNALALLLLCAVAIARALLGRLRHPRHALAEVTALHGYATAAFWALGFLALYLSPFLW